MIANKVDEYHYMPLELQGVSHYNSDMCMAKEDNVSHQRPLFKHIRNHTALFNELATIRNAFVCEQMALSDYQYHKTPKYLAQDGRRLSIEPERSVIIADYRQFKGIKRLLDDALPNLTIVPRSDIGFRYPTAATAGWDAPYIKRFRSEYFHRTDEERHICRPINLSCGIKSRGKSDNREEYEVWLPNENLEQDPTPLFIDKFGEDIPQEVLTFAAQPSRVFGWMGVKRAAFDAIYIDHNRYGDIAINIGLSVDAYNIGARPDLSYSPLSESSIAVGNAELEWEIMGYYAPKGTYFSQDQIWRAINGALNAISGPLDAHLGSQILPFEMSKTERILDVIAQQGFSQQDIEQWDLKPWEFLQTQSKNRTKAHDPSRTVNLLGRLNRLFYQPEHRLPSLQGLHDLIS